MGDFEYGSVLIGRSGMYWMLPYNVSTGSKLQAGLASSIPAAGSVRGQLNSQTSSDFTSHLRYTVIRHNGIRGNHPRKPRGLFVLIPKLLS